MKKLKTVLIILTIVVLVSIVTFLIMRETMVYQRSVLPGQVQIKNPAYALNRGPVILIDEGHKNFHTAGGRYKPFVQLLTADGYRFRGAKEEITPTLLADVDVLVIANAVEAPAKAEIDVIVQWVKTGKSLLLISDHPPFASPIKELSGRFGVDVSSAWASDPAQEEPDNDRGASWIRYERAKGALGEHPILTGRSSERIDVVVAFTGQSLSSETGTALLKLSDKALDCETRQEANEGVGGKSAAGRAQAIALEFGAGRVVVTGEAAMFSAQEVRIYFKTWKMGFNRPGNDNRRFIFNMMHWLTRALQN